MSQMFFVALVLGAHVRLSGLIWPAQMPLGVCSTSAARSGFTSVYGRCHHQVRREPTSRNPSQGERIWPPNNNNNNNRTNLPRREYRSHSVLSLCDTPHICAIAYTCILEKPDFSIGSRLGRSCPSPNPPCSLKITYTYMHTYP